MPVKNNIYLCVFACTRLQRSFMAPLFLYLFLRDPDEAMYSYLQFFVCIWENRTMHFSPCEQDWLFFFLLVCAFWDSCVCIFCVCVVVNTWAWGYNAHTALVVFLGVPLSKWLPRIASTRPSKRSEICALGLTLHPAIVYIYFCINNNEN